MSLYAIMYNEGNTIAIQKSMTMLVDNAKAMGYEQIDLVSADSWDHALQLVKEESNNHHIYITEYKEVAKKVKGKLVVKDVVNVCGYVDHTFSAVFENKPDILGFLLGKQAENREKRRELRIKEGIDRLRRHAIGLQGNAVVESSVDVQLGGAFEKDRITIRGLVVRVK